MPPGLEGEDFGKIALSSKLFEEKTAKEKAFQYDGNPERGGPSMAQRHFRLLCVEVPCRWTMAGLG